LAAFQELDYTTARRSAGLLPPSSPSWFFLDTKLFISSQHLPFPRDVNIERNKSVLISLSDFCQDEENASLPAKFSHDMFSARNNGIQRKSDASPCNCRSKFFKRNIPTFSRPNTEIVSRSFVLNADKGDLPKSSCYKRGFASRKNQSWFSHRAIADNLFPTTTEASARFLARAAGTAAVWGSGIGVGPERIRRRATRRPASSQRLREKASGLF